MNYDELRDSIFERTIRWFKTWFGTTDGDPKVLHIDLDEIHGQAVMEQMLDRMFTKLSPYEVIKVLAMLLSYTEQDRYLICCILRGYMWGYESFTFTVEPSTSALAYAIKLSKEIPLWREHKH